VIECDRNNNTNCINRMNAPVPAPPPIHALRVRHVADGRTLLWEEHPWAPPTGSPHAAQVVGCGVCGSDLEKLLYRECTEGQVLGHELVVMTTEPVTVRGVSYPAGSRFALAHHVPCGHCHQCHSGSESMCATFKQTNVYPGGFATQLALSQAHWDHVAFPMPDHVSDAAASCVEPLGCVLRGVRRGMCLLPPVSPTWTPNVLIIGLGFIGLMAAQVYRQLGFQIVAIEPNAARRDLALSHGWVTAALAPEEDAALTEHLEATTPLGRVDQVFLSVVRPSTLMSGTGHLKDGGGMVLFASALGSQGPASLDPSTLYFREISVISSYSPSLASLQEAADWIVAGRVALDPLITHTLPMHAGNDAVTLYREGQAIKVLLTP
jgi:L-iditol 2-dehydrogenase